MRSFTIDAENEQDFIQEIDRTQKNQFFQNNYCSKEKESLAFPKEGSVPPSRNTDIVEQALKFDSDYEKDYQELTSSNYKIDYEDEECIKGIDVDIDNSYDSFSEDWENIGEEEKIKRREEEDKEERGIQLLISYLKSSVSIQNSGNKLSNSEKIFYRNKNQIYTLSGNAIYDLNIREVVDNIIYGNENDDSINSNNKSNNLKEFISQNIESDKNLKIMFISNNQSTKNLFISKFLNWQNNNNNEIDISFDIHKKKIKLFDKNITLQIFDTSSLFHSNSVSKVYYSLSHAFFIFIEASNKNSQKFLENILIKIEKFLFGKTVILFGINLLFKEDCTIDDFNLREFARDNNMIFLPMKINDFNLKNNLLINIFNLILIKEIDFKSKNIASMKNKLNDKINEYSNNNNKKSNCYNTYDISKMNITSSLGYKKKYRAKRIDVFDVEGCLTKIKRERKLSVDF